MQQLKPKKGNIGIYLALLSVVMSIMIIGSRCSRASSESKTANSDTIKVGIQISPMGVTLHGDELSGFYYEMINDIAERENLTLKIDAFTQIGPALERLEAGDYDIVIADIPVTTELRERFDFTEPIYADRQTLLQLRDTITGEPPIKSQSDLRGDTVYLPANSPYAQRVRNLASELGDTIYIIEDAEYGSEQLAIMTALGQVKNTIVTQQVAESMAQDYPQLDTSVKMSFNQFQSWAMSKRDSVLCDSMSSYITRFKETPEFLKLVDSYLGNP